MRGGRAEGAKHPGAARARAAPGEDEAGRPELGTAWVRLPRLRVAQGDVGQDLGRPAETRVLPASTPVATQPAADPGQDPGEDPRRTMPRGPPRGDRGPQPDPPGLGELLSHREPRTGRQPDRQVGPEA